MNRMYLIFLGIFLLSLINNTTPVEAAWWNTTFAKCRNISFSGMVTDVNYTNEWAEQNFTDLTFSSLNELRIINASCNNGGSNQDRDIINNGTTWTTIGWYVNYTQTDANHNYSIYYNAIGAGDPATTNIFGIENTTDINTSSTTNLNGYHAYRDRTTSYLDSTCVKNSTGYRISSEIDATPICLMFHDGIIYIFGTTAWWRNESYKGNLTYVLNMNLSTTYNVTYRFYKDYFTATINLGIFGAQDNKLNLSSASGGNVVASANDSSSVVQNYTSGDNHVNSGENWTASYNNLSQYVWGLFGKNLNSTALGNRIYIGSTYQPMAEIGEDYNGGSAVNKRVIAGSVIRWQIISYDSAQSNNNSKYILPVHNVYRAFNNPLTVVEGSEQTQSGNYPLNLYFNGTANANKTYTYPNASNATGTVTVGETGYLYRDNVLKSTATTPNETILLGNGTYAYKLNSTNNATGVTYYVLVNKGTPAIHLALNGTENNVTYIVGQAINATGWVSTPSGATGNLYRNGTYANTTSYNQNNASQSSWNETFTTNENKTFWVTIPQNSSVIDAKLNLSGYLEPYQNIFSFNSPLGSTVSGIYSNESSNTPTFLWLIDENNNMSLIKINYTSQTYINITSKYLDVTGSLKGIWSNYSDSNPQMFWILNMSSSSFQSSLLRYNSTFDLQGVTVVGTLGGGGGSGSDWIGGLWSNNTNQQVNYFWIVSMDDYYAHYLNIVNPSGAVLYTSPLYNPGSDSAVGTVSSNASQISPNFIWFSDNLYNMAPDAIRIVNSTNYPVESHYLSCQRINGLFITNKNSTLTNIWIGCGYPTQLQYLGRQPSNPYLDVSGDGDTEWSFTGSFNQTNNQTSNFSAELNTYLSTCSADSNGNCNVSFVLHSGSAGIIQISAINISVANQNVIETLPIGVYNYSFNYSGNVNYTSAEVWYFANVTQASSNITLYLNGTQNNLTVKYPNSTINVTATINETGTQISIMKNGTILNRKSVV